ncbi:NADP-dependent oxidoreductase [Micrococcus porci]|uniref:NADP-dependent oxidoreductase n=1 Tax=Micrococcus porci TaxID=2856555 RepID=UPI003CF2EB50
MRALAFTRYGGPETMSLTDVPTPAPGPGEVLVRVAAAGLNPVDAMQREGGFKALNPYRFPRTAGNEFSGHIEALGAGVTGWERGQAVVARVGTAELGALADFAVTRAEHLAPAPASIPLEDAAGLPLAGLTAQQGLGAGHLDVQPGERLLITGAAGGVGQLAVQLAVLAGAEVTATASSAGEATVRAAGAHHVIDYRARTVSEGHERFDKVFDLVGGDTVTDVLASVERGGRVVTIAGPPTPGSLVGTAAGPRKAIAAVVERLMSRKVRGLAKQAGVSYEFFLMHADGAGLAELSRLVDGGTLTVPVEARFPLEDYADAFEQLESRRSKGKVIVTM